MARQSQQRDHDEKPDRDAPPELPMAVLRLHRLGCQRTPGLLVAHVDVGADAPVRAMFHDDIRSSFRQRRQFRPSLSTVQTNAMRGLFNAA
jgi:hypothetical protein